MLDEIKEIYASFVADAEKDAGGNKSAGARARKASLNLEKLLKSFRKESIARSK